MALNGSCGVQLCVDNDAMPIEDASVPLPEDLMAAARGLRAAFSRCPIHGPAATRKS